MSTVKLLVSPPPPMPTGACRGKDYGIPRAAVELVRRRAEMGTQNRPNGTRAAPPRAAAFQAHGSQRRRSRCNARISFALSGLYARTSREGCTPAPRPLARDDSDRGTDRVARPRWHQKKQKKGKGAASGLRPPDDRPTFRDTRPDVRRATARGPT